MPEVTITIGGRNFDVACQEGEEHYLHSAAKMLDTEAQALASQIGRIPEPRMLLMAGLMLADKTAAMEDKVRQMEDRVGELQTSLTELQNQPVPEPQKIEVPVIPDIVIGSLAEIAARSESLASLVEEKAAE